MASKRSHRTSLNTAVVLSVALLLVAASIAFGYTQNIYNSAYNSEQAKLCWCVTGSTRTWLSYIPGSSSATQATINTYIKSKDKYVWTQQCSDGSIGHDPRGWAWGMYNYTPAGYYFNDYKSTSQTTEDWELVYGVRAASQPAGALVVAGAHAVDVIGYQDLNDPWAPKPQQLYGFYIFDPWYGHGSSGLPNWGNGFAPDSYITIASWNSLYFTKDTNDGAFWMNDYATVLRSVSGTPSDTPSESYGDYVYGQQAVPADEQGTLLTPQLGWDVPQRTVGEAVSEGLATNGLIGVDSLGLDLTNYVVGPIAHVTSLAKEIPSYELVEVRLGGQLRAVARVDDVADGYMFAALSPADGAYPFTSTATLSSYMAANGITGTGALVWAWTSEGASPFMPYVESTNPSTGRPRYLTPQGVFPSLHLASGLTPSQ